MLSSIWHAILDNFRPITVWCTDMFIYYAIPTREEFGEPWTGYSWLQAAGMVVLLYGTAVYNAPNAGSILLKGEWYHICFDFSHEYDEIELEEQETEHDEEQDEWEARREYFKTRKISSMAERSPHISVHTQALRGLVSPKI